MSHAVHGRKAVAQRISKGSVEQCSGEVRKCFCDEKFQLDPPIPVFHGCQWDNLIKKF